MLHLCQLEPEQCNGLRLILDTIHDFHSGRFSECEFGVERAMCSERLVLQELAVANKGLPSIFRILSIAYMYMSKVFEGNVCVAAVLGMCIFM